MSEMNAVQLAGQFLRRLLSVFAFFFLAGALFLGWAQGRDFSWALQAEAEARGQALLGRPVSIGGAIGFEWRFAEVWVFADDVRTDEPEGAATLGAALTADRAGAVLGVWQLIQGRIDLRGAELRDAEVILRAGIVDGGDNQTVVEEAVDARANRILQMLQRLREVRIDNLHITRERMGADPQVVDIDRLTLVPNGEGLRGTFIGDVQGTNYDVHGQLGNLASFLRQDGSALSFRAQIGENRLDGSGTLTSAWPLVGQFTYDGTAGNVAALAEIAGLNLHGGGAGTVSGSARLQEGRGDITIDALVIEHNRPAEGGNPVVVGPLSGALAIFRRDGVFRGEGELQIARLDTSLLRTEQVNDQSRASDAARRSLADYPVPMNRFDRAAGRITLHVDELQHRNIILRDVELPITAEGGVLSFDQATARYRDAPLELSFNADVEDQAVYLSAEMRDFDMGAFLEDLGRRPIVDAPTHIALEGTGTGRTVREVMQSFTGQSNVSMGEGSIGRGGIDFLAADLLQAFFTGNEQGRTPLRCMVSRLDFEDGLGRSRVFLVDTNLITMTGRGRVFLNENRIDFELSPRPKNPTLLSLAADYDVTGEILSPSISPQTGDLLRGVATSVGGLALTGGTAALLPLLNMGEDVENACLDALSGLAPADVPADDESESGSE